MHDEKFLLFDKISIIWIKKNKKNEKTTIFTFISSTDESYSVAP